MTGAYLTDLNWKEAEKLLSDTTIVVFPLGAGAKEHGLHLPLCNDQLMAEYLARELASRSDVVVAPTITYSYYPAFVEYPGSISISANTATGLITDACLSLSRFGPRRFYVLNTGVSTCGPLEKAAELLKQQNIVLKYTNLHSAMSPAIDEVSTQEGGTHADEIETSMMLLIAPDRVRMKDACKDYQPNAEGRLTRNAESGFSYSPSGVWGDATKATKSKGEKVVKCVVDNLVLDVEALRAID